MELVDNFIAQSLNAPFLMPYRSGNLTTVVFKEYHVAKSYPGIGGYPLRVPPVGETAAARFIIETVAVEGFYDDGTPVWGAETLSPIRFWGEGRNLDVHRGMFMDVQWEIEYSPIGQLRWDASPADENFWMFSWEHKFRTVEAGDMTGPEHDAYCLAVNAFNRHLAKVLS